MYVISPVINPRNDLAYARALPIVPGERIDSNRVGISNPRNVRLRIPLAITQGKKLFPILIRQSFDQSMLKGEGLVAY